MSLTMYEASVPVFIRFLNNLSALLERGAAFADSKEIDPAVLVNARLYPDMLPLAAQVQIACDTAKRCPARLSDTDAPSHEDKEQSFADLQARIASTVDYLKGVRPADIDGTEDKAVKLETPMVTLDFTGQQYLFYFALPNFFFHVTTAHAILRHNGVDIGKMDYMGGR